MKQRSLVRIPLSPLLCGHIKKKKKKHQYITLSNMIYYILSLRTILNEQYHLFVTKIANYGATCAT